MLEKLNSLLERLPPQFFIKIQNEGGWVSACLFEEPPDGGWETQGDYFHSPAGSDLHNAPCDERYKYEPKVMFGTVSGEMWETLIRDLEKYVSSTKMAYVVAFKKQDKTIFDSVYTCKYEAEKTAKEINGWIEEKEMR